MEIENKVIVVTGGSGGIGKAMATRFIHENAKFVILLDINFDNSGKSGQSAEQSSSLCVINDYQELGIEIIKIFQDYSYNILKLNNNFTISTSWFT